MSNKPHGKLIGLEAEKRAQQYLVAQGLTIVARNYQIKLGEIDLIMKEPDDTLVFIEVKHRIDSSYGHPLAFITPTKQRRIIKTAQYFLQKQYPKALPACRFDAIGLVGNTQEITWIKNAFQVQ